MNYKKEDNNYPYILEKVKRGALIKKSTKSGKVVNEELKEKMDEISDATEQRLEYFLDNDFIIYFYTIF